MVTSRRDPGRGRWCRWLVLVVVVLVAWAAAPRLTSGQTSGPGVVIRVASLSEWVVGQHRDRSAFHPGLRPALDTGVVDRTVFWWQRGVIQRDALAAKPIRLLASAEAQALGGRPDVRLVDLRPPRGASAWTELVMAVPEGEGAVVLEVGGERNTIRQVLESFLVLAPGGALSALPLSPRALFPGAGVPVFRLPFGQPLDRLGSERFFRGPGLEVLVARSMVETVTNGAVTAPGLADAAPHPGNPSGDWREGDRVLLRVPLPALRAGAPGIVLGWKDRELRPDPDSELPRRAAVPGAGAALMGPRAPR